MDELRVPKYILPRQPTRFGEESEKFLSNVIAFRSTSEKMSSLTQELQVLYQECDFLHADVRALKDKLNKTAVEFGLQPLL